MTNSMDIRGIPTLYKGRQYRSRLEARWACFFDFLGWRYEYEPCDFEGWIPDFVLCEADTVYVEVKPINKFSEEVAAKIDATSCCDEVLIVGMTLLQNDDYISDNLYLGWLRQGNDEEESSWDLASFGVWTPDEHNTERIGFCHTSGSFQDRITGYYDGGCWGGLELNIAEVQLFWAQAGNLTQWRGRQSCNRVQPSW